MSINKKKLWKTKIKKIFFMPSPDFETLLPVFAVLNFN